MGGSGRLPDFFVIGAAKAGTSSLFRHLQHHPEVWMPEGKEVHFFDQPPECRPDIAWYLDQLAGAPPGVRVGDLTPNYLVRPWAAEAMAAVVPAARLVAILRNPVDRAYSHYQMQQAKFPGYTSFEAVVRAELEGRPIAAPHARYLAEGEYAAQLRRFMDRFAAEQLLVLLTDDLEADPAGVVRRICAHIGVDADFEPPNLDVVYNRTRPVRWRRLRRAMLGRHLYRRVPALARTIDRLNERGGYEPLDPDLRRELVAHFEAANAELAALIGRDLSRWGQPGQLPSSGTEGSSSNT